MGTEEHIQRASALKEARKGLHKNPIKTMRSLARTASLAKYFNPFIDWLYGIALSAALLKDILDITPLGLPLIGNVLTIMASFTIFMVMFITNSLGKKRIAILIAAFFMESIFGVDFLPMETAVVIIVFFITLKKRMEKAEEVKQKKAQVSNQGSSYSPKPEFAS